MINDMRSFEKLAYANAEMPDGLAMSEQRLYMCLQSLYFLFRKGAMSKEHCAKAKVKIMNQYESENQKDNLYKKFAMIVSATASAREAYAKERTLENADNICKAIDGVDYSKL